MKKLLILAIVIGGLLSCTSYNARHNGIDINNGMLIPYYIYIDETECFNNGDTVVLQYNDIAGEYRVIALYKHGFAYKDDCFVVIYKENN